MLDKVVALAVDATGMGSGVEVKLRVRAPRGECRLKLWDPEGRNPQALAPYRIVGPAPPEHTWPLEQALVRHGCTLTWNARLAGPSDSQFELRLRVFQKGVALPGGDFFYAGPLDDLEERSGRFHFKVERPA